MISTMESQLALTIIDHQGTNLRVARNHAAFDEVRTLLRESSAPACVVIEQIKTLLADPLEPILRWCARKGFALNRTPGPGEIDVAVWAPYLNRLMRAGSTPQVVIAMSRQVGDASTIDMEKICMLWRGGKESGGNPTARFLYQRPLPAGARVGDGVENLANVKGPLLGLVSTLRPWDGVNDLPGEVVQIGSRETPIELALAEPAILGNDLTYRIEEASPSGWMQEFSYDSIARAKVGMDAIRETGCEARLVNRMTGDVIDV